jgi:hypothetical protein
MGAQKATPDPPQALPLRKSERGRKREGTPTLQVPLS